MKKELVKIEKKNVMDFLRYIPDDEIEGLVRNKSGAIGLYADDVPSGAVICEKMSDEETRISSYYIDSSCRNNGLFKYMESEITRAFAARGDTLVTAEVLLPQMQETAAVFEKLGYKPSYLQGVLYEVDCSLLPEILNKVSKVTHNKNLLKVHFFNEITPDIKASFRYGIGKRYPEIMSPNSLHGRFLPELSTYYGKKGEIVSFALCTDLGNRVASLGALHTDQGGVVAAQQVLQVFIKALYESGRFDKLVFNAATDGSAKVAELLLKKYKSGVTKTEILVYSKEI